MADLTVKEAYGIFTGTVGSTDINRGDLVYFDGTDWELADATDNTKFAEAISIYDVDSGDPGVFCVSALFDDIDAPYTQGETQYLSPTAGALTTTRPGATVGNELAQVVGFSLSTSQVRIDIQAPHEFSIWVDLPYAAGSAAVTIDGDWAGLSMTGNFAAAHGTGVFPQNTVALKEAYLWIYNEDLLAGGGYTVDVSSGQSSETGTTTTDGITDTAIAVLTADVIVRADISAGFDAAGLVDAGTHFGVDIAKSSETEADDYRFHGVEVVVMVV